MAANYSHLIDIIFQAKNAGKTQAEIQKVFGTLDKGAKTTTTAAKGMGDFERAMRRAAIVAPIWMALRAVMMTVINLIKSQIQFLKDMEDAMARIQIVGKGTADQYNNLKYSLIGLSLAYGISASEAMEAAKIFAQQGKTVSETFLLTRAAMIGAQVLGQDVKTTVEDLTAAMKAFQIPIEEATSIIDKLINVERQFAVTSKDLSAGIKRTGATANQMGVSMAALVGDITAVVEVTRKSGQETARGLQFIYARLLTTGKPVIEQLAGIKFYLDEQGRATHSLTGNLRSATDVLDELASKWENLTNEEKLNIAVATGSKRQLVVMNALMQNYAHSIDARIAALTSAGAAERALAIIQDTVTYKTKQLTSAWNTLTATVADTSAWKGTLDILGKVIVGWASLINFEKGYRVILAQQVTGMQTEIETRRNQINSIEELIKLRDKLLTEPPTDKTTERIEKLNKVLEIITKQEPSIKIALETGKPEELEKTIKKIQEQLLAREIALKVMVDFEPQLDTLRKKLKEVEPSIGGYTEIELKILDPERYKKIVEIKKEIAELTKKQIEEEKKQLILSKAQQLTQEIMADEGEEELRISEELTAKEKEQLGIERQLIKFRLSGVITAEQQVEKEIELVKASKSIYNDHERNLKLEQLGNELLDAKLQRREKEIKLLNTYKNIDETLLDLFTEKLSIMREILKIAGNQESTIIRQEMKLKAMVYGEDYIRNSMRDRLDLAQALTREADEQERKSSSLVDLYKIATEYGIDAAREISKYLAGVTKFANLSAKATEALQEYLPTKYEESIAEKYFRERERITFPEELERRRIEERNRDILRQVGLGQITVPEIVLPPTNLTVRNDIRVFIDGQQLTEGVIEEIKTLLNQDGNEISESVDKRTIQNIEEF